MSARPKALYSLMEKDVRIVVRPKDEGVAKKAAEKAVSTYQSKSGFECKSEVKAELPKDSYVELSHRPRRSAQASRPGPAVSSSWATTAGSRSTTRLTSVSACSRKRHLSPLYPRTNGSR